MKEILSIFYLSFYLSFRYLICVADNTQDHGRTYSTIQDHLNFIKNYDKTDIIFTQRYHPSHQKYDNSSSSAESKFLGVFTLVKIANLQCTVGNLMGFCVTAAECTEFGGSRIGDCANGYGSCCYNAIKCGGSSSMNVTYIQNADYPDATSSSGTCSHTITRQSNVCNLRLDFADFELSDPIAINNDATNGQCLGDQMTVTGVATKQLTYLCGKMPPTWHFYLDVRDATNPTTFTFNLNSGVTKDRKWNIKVTQVDCDRKIPQGCGQYFTGTTGDPLYSFNWNNNNMYLYGMNYAICFRQEKGYCTHSFVNVDNSWVVCPDSLAFPSADIGTRNFNPGGVTSNGADTLDCNINLVATAWPSPITTNNYGPTIIYHFTNQENRVRLSNSFGIPAAANPGFYFTWTHNKC